MRLCDELVDCVRATWCDGVACFCGKDLLGCTLSNPTGPCREEVEAAARSGSISVILAAATDASSPFGRAIAFGSCAYDKCAEPCDFK